LIAVSVTFQESQFSGLIYSISRLSESVLFGRPFVKRFALCYQTVACLSCHVLSCLSVTLVYCDQTVGWIKMKLGMQVGLVSGHIVLDRDPVHLPKGHSPQFLAHICCGQIAGWIKMPLGMEVGLGPGDFVSDGDPALSSPKRGRSPQFSAHIYCGQTARCIKMPLRMEVSLSPGDFCVRWGPSSPP